MAYDKNQEIFFANKKMTVDEFITEYELENETNRTIDTILEKLIKKGKLRVLEETNHTDDAFELIGKELDLEAKLAQIEADSKQEEAYKAKKNKEGRLTFEEIEIDYPTLTLAEDMLGYAHDKLNLHGQIIQNDDVYTVKLLDVTESDVSAINRRNAVNKAGKVILEGTDRVAGTVIETAGFVGDRIVVPASKAVIKTTLGLTKSVVKTTASAGSSLISSTTENFRNMSKELSTDKEVLKAKKDLIDAKDAIMKRFRKRGGGGIRFK